jgi:hypothetical protein
MISGFHLAFQRDYRTGATYLVDATFVSRFCSNSFTIQRTGTSTSGQAASPQFTGRLGGGFSKFIAGIQNNGDLRVSVEAICIDDAGMVPGNPVAGLGPTATTIQFAISP